jgi:hypothetical protein
MARCSLSDALQQGRHITTFRQSAFTHTPAAIYSADHANGEHAYIQKITGATPLERTWSSKRGITEPSQLTASRLAWPGLLCGVIVQLSGGPARAAAGDPAQAAGQSDVVALCDQHLPWVVPYAFLDPSCSCSWLAWPVLCMLESWTRRARIEWWSGRVRHLR